MELEIQRLFHWYLLGMLLLFAAISVWEGVRARANQWQISEEKLCRCPDCHMAFIVPRESWFAKCPRCERNCRVPAKFQHGS